MNELPTIDYVADKSIVHRPNYSTTQSRVRNRRSVGRSAASVAQLYTVGFGIIHVLTS